MTLIKKWLEERIEPEPRHHSGWFWISEACGTSLGFHIRTQEVYEHGIDHDGVFNYYQPPITWSPKLRSVVLTLVCPD